MIFSKIILFYFLFLILLNIFIYYRFKKIDSVLLISCSFIFLFSGLWLLFLLSFYFNLSGRVILLFLVLLTFYFLYNIYRYYEIKYIRINLFLISIYIIYLYSVYQYFGTIFTEGDSIVSWNRWAMELSDNIYKPYNAAYPILFPGLWSIIYKIQGSADIWIFSKITLFFIPSYLLLLLISLYQKTKNIVYLIIIVISFVFIISEQTYNGYMDMQVTVTGLFSLILLYESSKIENNRNKFKYLIASLLIAGISTIIKQSGFVFLIFSIIYSITFLKINNGYIKIYLGFIFISLLYFGSYLLIYFSYQDDIVGNFSELHKLSTKSSFMFSDYMSFFIKISNKYLSAIANTKWILIIMIILNVISIFYKNIRRDILLFNIFFLIGIISWIIFFSYDARNSFWTFSFLILSTSVLFSKILPKDFLFKIINFKYINIKLRFFFISFSIIIIININYFKNDNLKFSQNMHQSKIGFVSLAEELSNILKHTNRCVKVNSNIQVTMFNSLLRPYASQIDYNGYSPKDFLDKFMQVDCVDGRYWVVAFWYPDTEIQNEYSKMIEEKKIVQISGYIYKINPKVEINE